MYQIMTNGIVQGKWSFFTMQEISAEQIRKFYKKCKEIIRKQDHYESILYFLYMKPEQKEKWFLLLKEKCQFQREVFESNNKDINENIMPFLKEGEGHRDFNDELADTFLDEIIKMARQMTFDSLLTVEILKKLVVYYTEQNNREKQILSYFYLGYFDGYINDPQIRQEVYQCYQKVVSYRNQYEEITDIHVKKVILAALFNRSNWDTEVSCKKNYNTIHMSHLMEAYEVYQREKDNEIWKENISIPMVLEYIKDEICYELLKPGNERAAETAREIETQYYQEKEKIKERLSAREYYNYWKHKQRQGEIGEKDYFEKLYEYYCQEPWKKIKNEKSGGYNYNYNNMVQMMPLFLPELFDGAKKYDFPWIEALKEDVEWYYTSFPRTGNKAYVDRTIVYEIMELLPHYNQDEAMELYESVLLSRQGSTEIHVRDVAKLAVEVAGRIIDKKPEYMIGILGIQTPEEVQKRKKGVLTFLRKGALHHDRGKLLMSTTINMQLRKLTDQEFATIKKHPEYGLKGAESYQSLKKYNNIILGHHKFYNGKGGYPEAFDNRKCKDKFAIDLITICDCLDAATDNLGRNYMNDKNVRMVLVEMEKEKGIKYSPEIVDFILADENLIQSLEYITTKEREEAYYQTYHRFAREKNQREVELLDLRD